MSSRYQLQAMLLLLTMLVGSTAVRAHNGGFTALAVPVPSINVDGFLDDWPDHVPVYGIHSVLKGFFGYDGSDPTPDDLQATFRVAWHPAAQRILVAVTVIDDRLNLGSGSSDTDALEVYVDGSHGVEDAQQYLMFPGDGSYGGIGETPNPPLNKAGATGAWTVRGDTITYEWSLQAFEDYPGMATVLSAGQRIGFDVVAVDKDASGKGPTWMSWSPRGGKASNPDRLGDIYLLSSTDALDDMIWVQGRVVRTGTDESWRGIQVDVRDTANQIWDAAVTGPKGHFKLLSPAGSVTVSVPETGDSIELSLKAGDKPDVRIEVLYRPGVGLPVWPFAITLGLFGVAAAGALWPLRRRLHLLGGAIAAPQSTFRHLARHPEWTAPAALVLLSAAVGSVSAVNQYPGQLWGALVGMPGALSTALLILVPLMMFLALVAMHFVLWIGWSFLLWALGQMAGGDGRFFHIVSMAGYAGVPAALGICVGGLVVAFTGESPTSWTGLGALQLATGPMADVLAQVNLFALWPWALAVVGLEHSMNLSTHRSAVVTGCAWVLTMALIYAFHATTQAIATSLSGGLG